MIINYGLEKNIEQLKLEIDSETKQINEIKELIKKKKQNSSNRGE